MAKNDDDEEKDVTEDGDDEEGGKKVGGKKALIIVIVLIVLLGGVGAGLYFSGVIGGKGGEHEEAAVEDAATAQGHASADGEGAAVDPNKPSFYDLPEFLVNLNTGGKQASFLKMKVALEVKGGVKAVEQVQAVEPRIVDNFQTYLRELRASDLQGSAGLYRLREELLLRINKETQPVEVSDILFKEMIVQ